MKYLLTELEGDGGGQQEGVIAGVSRGQLDGRPDLSLGLAPHSRSGQFPIQHVRPQSTMKNMYLQISLILNQSAGFFH
jgi:hypothetical protein